MNKYLVTRHIERNGRETKFDYGIMAISPEQAISRTRYTNTRNDRHPNGEPTDYTNERGEHIYWTAELIEAEKKAPEIDTENDLEDAKPATAQDYLFSPLLSYTSEQIAGVIYENYPSYFKNLNSCKGAVNTEIRTLNIKPITPKGRRYFLGDKALEVFKSIEKRIVAKIYDKGVTTVKKTPEDKPTPSGGAFVLPERTRKDAEKYAKLLGVRVEDVYFRAVKYYLARLGKMTLEEFLKAKEEANNA